MRIRTLVIGCALLSACFPNLDALSGQVADAGSDAGLPPPSDAAADTGAEADAGGDAQSPPNDADTDAGNRVFVPNGSFETTGPECGPGWNANNSTLETSPNARTGAIACRVCRLGNPGGIRSAPLTIPAGPGHYLLSVWFRNSGTHLASPKIVATLMSAEGQVLNGGNSVPQKPEDTYGPLVVDYTAPAKTNNLVVQVTNADGADASCFVIDDISIERLP